MEQLDAIREKLKSVIVNGRMISEGVVSFGLYPLGLSHPIQCGVDTPPPTDSLPLVKAVWDCVPGALNLTVVNGGLQMGHSHVLSDDEVIALITNAVRPHLEENLQLLQLESTSRPDAIYPSN